MNWADIIRFLLGIIVIVAAFPQEPTNTNPATLIEKIDSLVNVSHIEENEKQIKVFEQAEEQKIPDPTAAVTLAPIKVQIEPPPTYDSLIEPPTQSSTEVMKTNTTESPISPTAQPKTLSSTISPFQRTPSSSTAPPVIKGNQPGCIKGNSVYCEQLEDAEINKMIKVIQHLNKTDTYFTDNPKELAQRRNDPAEDALCHTVERYIYPQSARNRENEWRYIVNNGRFTQAVRVEECTLVGSACQLSPKFPATYQSECRQKYIYHNLLGYDSDGKVVKDFYKLPSCCQCFVKPRK